MSIFSQINRIKDNLFITDLFGVMNLKPSDNIDVVVTIMHYKPALPCLVEHIYYELDDEDDSPIHQHFQSFIDIVNSGKNVLVHCYSGASRSVTLVAAYLISRNYKYRIGAVDRTIASIQKKRSCASPNDGFIAQLETFRTMLVSERKKLKSAQEKI